MWKFLSILGIFMATASTQVIDDDIEYYLWNNRTSREVLRTNNYGNNIINSVPVKILIHGWLENINSFWYPEARINYVRLGTNVICIDWSRHSQLTYYISVSRLSAMGAAIARFIIGLSNTRNIPLNRFHIIGHSLGAHISGFTGKTIQLQTNTNLGRITGLDPAGPGFLTVSNSERLYQTDANQVDTVHTDAGGLGIDRSLGHVNFWPNGGTASQPGCLIVPCSHSRACLLFAEGILSNGFVARRCSSWTNYRLGFCNSEPVNSLGENVDFSTTGDFYLATNSESPYTQG